MILENEYFGCLPQKEAFMYPKFTDTLQLLLELPLANRAI